MSRRFVAWLGAVALLALHLDFWRGPSTELWLGWIPTELAWRLVWMLGASAYLVFFTRWVWGEGDAR